MWERSDRSCDPGEGSFSADENPSSAEKDPSSGTDCVRATFSHKGRRERSSLNIEKKKRNSTDTATVEWDKGLEPKLLKIGAVTLAPSTEAGKSSGLTFHYPPYAVGTYAEGQYVAFVPWESLKPYLTPEGARIFGGARPQGDDDGRR